MLVRVLARLRPDEFDVQVFTIGMPGPFTEHLEQLGIPNRLYEFLRPKLPNPWHLLTLARDLRRFRPDVVQGWMYLGNLYGGVAAKLARRDMPIAWNIRHSTLDPQRTRPRFSMVRPPPENSSGAREMPPSAKTAPAPLWTEPRGPTERQIGPAR